MDNNEVRRQFKMEDLVWLILCIVLNISGKWIGIQYDTPVWFDQVGTFLLACRSGWIPTVIVGVVPQIVFVIRGLSYGASIWISLLFVLLLWNTIRMLKKKNYMHLIMTAFWLGVICGLVRGVIDYFFYDGLSGNIWSDAFFDMLRWNGMPIFPASILSALIIEVADKQVCVTVGYLLLLMVRSGFFRIKKIVVTLVVFSLGTVFLATTPVLKAKEQEKTYDYKIYNNQTGLMSSEANAVAETADGCIWIGSYAGLTRYDGSNFEFVRESGVTNVKSLYLDRQKRLWIATNDNGLVRYENGAFSYFSQKQGLNSDSIYTIVEDSRHQIYMGTKERIYRMDADDKIVPMSDELLNVSALEIFDGALYGIEGSGRIFRMELDETGEITYLDSKMQFNCLESNGNVLFAAGTKNVEEISWDGKKLHAKVYASTNLGNIMDLMQAKDGTLWIGADEGIGCLKNKAYTEKHYEGFDGAVQKVFEDYQGNLWFASSRYGVLKLAKNQFWDLFSQADIASTTVNAVCEYKDSLYCATDTGLYILEEESHKRIQNALTKQLKDVRIRSMLVDSDERLWIGTYSDQGLICVDGTSVKSINTGNSKMTSDKVRCFLELSDGTIVVGTADGINYIKNDQVVSTVKTQDGLENSQILSMVRDEEDRVYVGSDGAGIYVLEEGRIVANYRKDDGLTSNIVLRMIPYMDGCFVVTGSGLCFMDMRTLPCGFRKLESFPYYNNYDIVLNDDMAYVTSSAGIYEVDAKELYEDKVSNYELFDNTRGLHPGMTANSWSMVKDDVLYLCCNNGITCYNTNSDPGQIQYKFGVTDIVTDGIMEVRNNRYILDENVRQVTIYGSVRNYAMNSVKVRFYVKDYNKGEVCEFSQLEPIKLYNLKAGTYTIHFQILDHYGEQVLQAHTYIMEKRARMWENDWYRMYLILMFVDAIAFVTGSILYMVFASKRKKEKAQQYKDRAKELKREVSAKTAEIQNSKREVETLLDETIVALGSTVEAKDRYTSGHSKRVAKYAKMIANRMGKSGEEQKEIYYAGLLHDVGKIRIPDEIINKEGKLTDEEFNYIKLHPVAGYHILKGISQNRRFSEGARFHHERYDGKGYPNGLVGEDIPEIARIIGVADAYDAMASDRSYRKALPQEVIRGELVKGKGTQFDPNIADIMISLMDEDTDYKLRQLSSLEKVILIVDDESINRKLAQFALKEETFYKTLTAESGQEALEMIQAQHLDLVLLDIEMPKMNGFEVLEKIREIKVNLPVVFMTADKNMETIKKAENLGVEDYLTKPYLPAALKEIVHSVLKEEKNADD
ncbi:MAG: HD domain-containing phosphohydrolase [Wujia sp.]